MQEFEVKQGDAIVINQDIVVEVVHTRSGELVLAIRTSKDVEIVRGEEVAKDPLAEQD